MIEIIPAIDIIEGKCVRLTQGDYNTSKIYNTSPIEVAKSFEDAGFERLHLVDLDGAKGNGIVNLKVLEEISSKTKLNIDFGGGIKSKNDLLSVFNAGAKYATIGSLAAKKRELVAEWIQEIGAEKFIIGIDAFNNVLRTNGWTKKSKLSLMFLIEFYKNVEVRKLMITDISKDGKLEGIDIDFYKNVINHYPNLEIIASGGVSSVSDVESLKKINISGVVIGKAIYENAITLNELKKI